MTTVETSKILAGVGSLILGSIVGIILFMIGMKGLSEHYKDDRVYNGLVTGGILLIISWILFFVGVSTLLILIGIPIIIAAFIFAIASAKYIRNCFNALAERSGENLFRTAGSLIWIGAILSILIVGFLLIWVGFIIAAIGFFTLKVAPTSTGNYFAPPYGYNAPPPPYGYTQSPQAPQQSPTSAGNSKANFCPNCGASVAPDGTFCANCGKQI
jgi:uncharacterized membrane protein